MTMIMGLNLSNKVYLVADTRVSFPDGSFHDNILKIRPLVDKAFHRQNEIAVAVAGNVGLTSYLYKEIQTALNKGTISTDIRKFYDAVEGVIDKAIVTWVNEGKPYKNCCLLFAGTCEKRAKEISLKKLNELVNLYDTRALKKQQELLENGFAEQVKTDPIWQIFDDKMRKEAGMSVMENLAQSFIPVIRPYIKEALEKNDPFLDDEPDSLVFGVKIDVATRTIKKEVAEWGDFLIYGDRVNRDSVPDDMLASLELFWAQEKEHSPHLMEGSIMTMTILDLAKKHKIGSIGGTVMLVWTDKDGMHISGKDLIVGSPMQVKIDGNPQPLIPFTDYPNGLPSSMEMEMRLIN